ncbi:enoyl-CoA hydratase-related protein [Sphingobium sp. HBC34]|uniref:Enoyl-CoA hydratase-related protein n=1 Tax=Sphingobium cyanobacteriorum TaxID=3063954 RepID=A0ABT8ZPG6_9SPHN|nr:enoyl-CoA hydratase-related protein [Sphingobium sp. HBC34]MDO7836434.1 enoyl-CoA hydratase-related protein [Sphingobium sp. HBC34]
MRRDDQRSQILWQAHESILTLMVNRPDKLNAYTNQVGADLTDAIRRADADDRIGVVILRGRGRGILFPGVICRRGRTVLALPAAARPISVSRMGLTPVAG